MTTPIRSMPELIEALRKRKEELQLTNMTIDHVSGMQPGYTSKLLAPKPIKNLGPVSFEAILATLGLCVQVVEDPESVKRFSNQWTKRVRPTRSPKLLPSPSMSPSIENQVPSVIEVTPAIGRLIRNPEWMKEIGLRGNQIRNATMSSWKRKVIARKAAKARWGKERERKQQPEMA
jgi:hypothetical protein